MSREHELKEEIMKFVESKVQLGFKDTMELECLLDELAGEMYELGQQEVESVQ